MTAKEYLQQAYKIERRINIIVAKVEKLRSQLEYKGISYDSGGSHGSSNGDAMLNTLVKINEYESKQNELADKLIEKRFEIEKAIEGVQNAVQREVLERRYLLYEQWESHAEWRTDELTGRKYKVIVNGIAENMNYSVRAIYKIHGKALQNITVPEKECSEVQ